MSFFSPDLFMKISNFSKTVHTVSKILQSFYTQRGPCVRKGIKIVWLECEKQPKMAKISPKTVIFRIFSIFSKIVHRFELNFPQSFYTILESDMCNGIKIVWLGCEKHSQKCPKKLIFRFFFDFLKNCLYDSKEIL